MLKDFGKNRDLLNCSEGEKFLKGISKAWNISPAVTQQIKYIENYLEAKIIDRNEEWY